MTMNSDISCVRAHLQISTEIIPSTFTTFILCGEILVVISGEEHQRRRDAEMDQQNIAMLLYHDW